MRQVHHHARNRVHVKDLLEKVLCPSCQYYQSARCVRSFVKCEGSGVVTSPLAWIEFEAHCNVLLEEGEAPAEVCGETEGVGAS